RHGERGEVEGLAGRGGDVEAGGIGANRAGDSGAAHRGPVAAQGSRQRSARTPGKAVGESPILQRGALPSFAQGAARFTLTGAVLPIAVELRFGDESGGGLFGVQVLPVLGEGAAPCADHRTI